MLQWALGLHARLGTPGGAWSGEGGSLDPGEHADALNVDAPTSRTVAQSGESWRRLSRTVSHG